MLNETSNEMRSMNDEVKDNQQQIIVKQKKVNQLEKEKHLKINVNYLYIHIYS